MLAGQPIQTRRINRFTRSSRPVKTISRWSKRQWKAILSTWLEEFRAKTQQNRTRCRGKVQKKSTSRQTSPSRTLLTVSRCRWTHASRQTKKLNWMNEKLQWAIHFRHLVCRPWRVYNYSHPTTSKWPTYIGPQKKSKMDSRKTAHFCLKRISLSFSESPHRNHWVTVARGQKWVRVWRTASGPIKFYLGRRRPFVHWFWTECSASHCPWLEINLRKVIW